MPLIEDWKLWFCAAVLGVAFAVRNLRKKGGRKPVGPLALPFIGHLHLMGPVPHRSLYKLSQRYGKVLLLQLGCRPLLVVSSASLAEEVLKIQDHLFAHRPRIHFVELVFYRSRGAVFMELTPRWKSLRKFYAQHVVSPHCIVASKGIRHEEMQSLLRRLRLCTSGGSVDLRNAISDWMLNVMTRVLFSERADDRDKMLDFPEVFHELSDIFTVPMLADFIPYLGAAVDPGGIQKRLLREQARMDAIMESIVCKRLEQISSDPSSTPKDVLTSLLQFEGRIPKNDGVQEAPNTTPDSEGNEAVKAVVLELLAATTDTTTAAVEWAMAELLSHKDTALEKLKLEIEGCMEGKETSQVNEELLCRLPYLEAVMKEALRLHPPASLLLPHFTKEATKVAGCTIQANTILAVNAWAIGRDESVWKEANQFKPERFLPGGSDANISFEGHTNFQLLAFGKGRRGCPGRSLGMVMASLVVANLVHNFELRTSQTPDLTEKMCAANMLANPLHPNLYSRQHPCTKTAT
ncbi:hypothetical protein KP509_17G026600 [Ceratopteris richardii]|uniref:Cytochrome P450 n=1 Tax=Ceratopteris richardii TaxID=49495 RepID=A0A8T2SSY5_CERRI|nr:hypothetical protein KP509_17G026600 [Ceratopteris richardii]KAH7372883.1 hypothetical protein KP509_17G026600 [Ceratopteris richardii]